MWCSQSWIWYSNAYHLIVILSEGAGSCGGWGGGGGERPNEAKFLNPYKRPISLRKTRPKDPQRNIKESIIVPHKKGFKCKTPRECKIVNLLSLTCQLNVSIQESPPENF